MGVSTNGLLAYGYDLGGPEQWFLEGLEYDELEGAVPWWPERANDDEEDERDFVDTVLMELCPVFGFERPRWGWEVSEKLPVQVATHCSLDYPMYLLVANSTIRTSRRGSAKVLNFESMMIQDEWNENLQKALDALGIKPKQPAPGWILASLWG